MSARRFGLILSTVALTAAVLLLTSCADSKADSSNPVSTNEVTMPRSYRFSPAAIQITAGTTVTWRNEDNFTHSVQLLGDGEPDHVVHPGESVAIAFSQPGTFRYECSFHPRDMSGTVTVTAAPSSADGYGR